MKLSVKKTETKIISKSADAIPAEENPIPKLLQNIGRKFLSQLKQKALRNNSWFRVLSFDKRRLIDAVIQTVNKIHSSLLLKILLPLVNKLLQAIGGMQGLMGKLAFGMESFGRPLAQKISGIAKSWGNFAAAHWAVDDGFIRFLTVLDMNDLPVYRVSTKL